MLDRIEIYFKNFTLLDESALKRIYEWRNMDYIRINMDNSDIFPYAEHEMFCKSLSLRKDKIYFEVSVDGNPCGVLDFVNINQEQNTAESGFYVIEPYNNFSSAISRAANSVCLKLGLEKVVTHIHKTNEKAVLYNLIKLKGTYVGEDENSVYCEFITFPEYPEIDPFFQKYTIKIDL